MRRYIFFILLFASVVALSQFNTSPNMNLPIPIPGQTPGPAWANDINASLTLIDQHNHSPGYGVQIQPNGLNISSDLSFQSHNATLLRTTRYSPQVSPITNSGLDIGEIYVSGNELYYNDVSGGNQIQITSNGSVNAGSGSIGGLPSGTASASYSAGTFSFNSATSVGANIFGRNILLSNNSSSSKTLTLQPPSAMGANISETFPTIPGQTNLMTMDTSGNMAAATNVDGTTLTLSSNTLFLTSGGVGTTQLANGGVTRPKLASVGQQVSATSGGYVTHSTSYADVTNLSVTITTTGRPVLIFMEGTPGAGISYVRYDWAAQPSPGQIQFLRGVSVIANFYVGNQGAATPLVFIPPGAFFILDAPTAGTYTYKVQGRTTDAGGSSQLVINQVSLVAYEL